MIDLPSPPENSPQSSNEEVELEKSESQIQPARSSIWKSMVNSAVKARGVVGNTVKQASSAVTGTAGKIGEAATHTGSGILDTAADVGSAIGKVASHAGNATVNAVKKVPEGLGQLANIVGDNPQLRLVTKHLKVDDLLCGLIEQVDVVKAEAYIKQLQAAYPQETSYQIAHRIIVRKTIYAGSTGFASSFLPGVAAGLFTLDLVATLALQAEMIYQIAAAYHLDLGEPSRKGEVLAIFGLTLGGNSGIKAGLGFTRNLPTVGAVIGASSNAVLIYTLGQAACQFYESHVNPLVSEESLQGAQILSEQYLENAITQEILMDQILVYVLLAGQPGKTWKDILPELPYLSFAPASIEAITACVDSPPKLEDLLEQINEDFAVSLLAQCQKLAESDGVLTPEEERTLEQISQRLGDVINVFMPVS